jgi:saccharopine dehydrogenase-like NADP-dependent oxidoreductase
VRVIVIGGAGNFGARIVRALKQEPRIELLVAGRSKRTVKGAEEVGSVTLDHTSSRFPESLRELSPGLVIHCAGPFQGQDYRVAQAAMAAGAHYIDLADGREFVAHFSREIDAAAIKVGRAAITGASTLPALSCAVVEELCRDLVQLRVIQTVIAPGQRAPRGRATLEGVFSYLGRPFLVWRSGRWRKAWGWMDLRRVPLRIGGRWAAACDVPDLALFPGYFTGVEMVTFHAALEIAAQHFVLWTLAALRRLGLPLPVKQWGVMLEGMAGLFDGLAGDRGGMRVAVIGQGRDGKTVGRAWHLIAPAVNGPEIPCMPAILLARGLARGQEVRPGAYPCMGLLRLADFDSEFRKWGIVTEIGAK